METPHQDIEIAQGATFLIGFNYLTPDGAPVDLTSFEARLQVRERVGGKVLADLSTQSGTIVIDPLAGSIAVEFPASVTRAMDVPRAFYDLFLTSQNGNVTKLIEGEITIRTSITRI